jgi:hypothetical protein
LRTVLILHPDNLLRNGFTMRASGFTRARRVRALLDFSRFFLAGVFGPHRPRSAGR